MGGGLKLLQVGQVVSLQHHEYNLSVTVLPAGQSGARVTEVGVDYFVMEDDVEGVITRIPMHLLKAVSGVIPAEESAEEPAATVEVPAAVEVSVAA